MKLLHTNYIGPTDNSTGDHSSVFTDLLERWLPIQSKRSSRELVTHLCQIDASRKVVGSNLLTKQNIARDCSWSSSLIKLSDKKSYFVHSAQLSSERALFVVNII